jgi:acetyltransferase-like isoleucine patch superfamily enzyme
MKRYKGFFFTLGTLRHKMRVFFGYYYYLLGKGHGIKFQGKSRFVGRPRFRIYPETVVTVGENCEFFSGHTDNLIGINRPCIISSHTRGAIIQIGENCGFCGTVIGAFKSITIGKIVKCGANTLITDSDWHLEDPRSGNPRPIVIGDNVWLGANTVVLKGVTIGENSLIGINSVVTKDIPPNVIAAGNPCHVIKAII